LAVLPYDIAGRNAFYRKHDFLRRSQALLDAFLAALETNHPMLSESIDRHFALKKKCNEGRPEVMNSELCDSVVELEHGFRRAVRQHLLERGELSSLSDTEFFALEDEEWDRRNQAMADNLCRLSKASGKLRHVATVGHEHRYALIPLLEERCTEVTLRPVREE
jgi:hypothetical protein